MMTRVDYLNIINDIIEEEGGEVLEDGDLLRKAELDSFGHTMLFVTLDTKFSYFSYVPAEVDVFSTIPWETITTKDILDRLTDGSE